MKAKRWILSGSVIALSILMAGMAWAQVVDLSDLAKEKGLEEAKKQAFGLTTGLGFTTIDGVLHYRVRAVPELRFAKFSAGLNVDLLWNSKTGAIRPADKYDGKRFSRIIDHLGYGGSKDLVEAKVGAIQDYTLGHGFLMNHYSNQTDENYRKPGLYGRVGFPIAGGQFMTSNLGRFEIYALRGFVRPLSNMALPIVKNFEAGLSWVGDIDPDQTRSTEDAISAWGFDAGLPIAKSEAFEADLYTDFGKINHHGAGGATGIAARVQATNLFAVGAKLEERFLGKEFIPRYFDGFYEVERYRDSSGVPLRKIFLLATVDTAGKNGTFGELAGYVLDKVTLRGNYQHYSKLKYSGILHLTALAPKLVPKTDFTLAYDQKNVESTKDLFKTNENTLVTIEAGREVYPHFMLYLTYQRTFEYREAGAQDEKGNTVVKPGYYAIEKFSPRVDFKLNW
jgi:hypothetical protein